MSNTAMDKKIIMELMPAKETKGCFRYGHVSGDAGIATIYVRKDSVTGELPQQIEITIKAI